MARKGYEAESHDLPENIQACLNCTRSACIGGCSVISAHQRDSIIASRGDKKRRKPGFAEFCNLVEGGKPDYRIAQIMDLPVSKIRQYHWRLAEMEADEGGIAHA